jgi:serine/threonine protein kinase
MSKDGDSPNLFVIGIPSDGGADPNDRTSRMRPAFAYEPDPEAPGDAIPEPMTNTMPPVVDEMFGRRFGGYVIESLIGHGGMGKVYLARNSRMAKKVAVKVVVPEHSRTPRVIDRFFQEAKAAAQIDDPNIVDVLDAGEFDNGRCYLVMPFIEGGSLEDLCVRLDPMPIDIAVTILLQICGGLEAAHRHGIVHRDIKPHNILVGLRQDREHYVRIVDFGIAKLLDPFLAGQFRTQTKAMMGTPGYMAPEQARGERLIDARADIYAVATVAYRMLTGRRPYPDNNLYAFIEKQASNAPFPRPRELRPDIPQALDDAIMHGLVNQRDHRMPSMRHLILAIAAAVPEGEQMLQLLVPRLAITPLHPNAATLPPFLDQDFARRTPFPSKRAGPVRKRLALRPLYTLLLLVVGCLVGVLIARILWRNVDSARDLTPPQAAVPRLDASPRPEVAPTRPDVEVATSVASQGPAAPVSETLDPVPRVESRSTAVVTSPVVERPHSTDPDVPAVLAAGEPAPSRAAPSPRSAADSSPKRTVRAVAASSSDAQAPPPTPTDSRSAPSGFAKLLTREESARMARQGVGVLIVGVRPWADISLDGKPIGTSPKRKELPVGKYLVRVSANARSEDVPITISPGKVTIIERIWR